MCAVVFLTLTLSRRSLESLVLLLGGAPQSISMDQCRASAVDLAARGSTGLDRPPELTPGRGGPTLGVLQSTEAPTGDEPHHRQ